MRKPEWPGIATAVGIVLILTLVIVGARDDFHLKEWQTLATGLLALLAAGVAYLGATANVRHQIAVLERETDRKKLALYSKIEFAFRDLSERAGSVCALFWFGAVGRDTVFSKSSFFIQEPPEIEEAWEDLNIFPRVIIGEITAVRNSLRSLAKLGDALGDKTILVPQNSDMNAVGYPLQQARTLVDDIRRRAWLVADDLEPIIKELAPPMDEDERMIRYYGDPSDFGDEDH
jgi:hypothetical protein